MHDALLDRSFTVNSPRLPRQRRRRDATQPTHLEDHEVESVAQRVRELAQRPRLLSDPAHYAVRLGFVVVDHLDGDDALATEKVLHYRWDPDPRVRGARIAWALAAALLSLWGWTFSDADVWRVAAALLWPRTMNARVATLDAALRLQPCAPAWLLAERIP